MQRCCFSLPLSGDVYGFPLFEDRARARLGMDRAGGWMPDIGLGHVGLKQMG